MALLVCYFHARIERIELLFNPSALLVDDKEKEKVGFHFK